MQAYGRSPPVNDLNVIAPVLGACLLAVDLEVQVFADIGAAWHGKGRSIHHEAEDKEKNRQ